jgi:hypothetical protein
MTAQTSLLVQTTCVALIALGSMPALHATQPAAAAAPPTAGAVQDPCNGAPRCYNAGAFIAEVMQVSATAMTPGARHHSVSINVRFRNVSDKPVILAYRSGSSAALDNFGNAFTWGRPGTHDTSMKGIGMVAGRSVDTQFSLAPGQSRNATFGIIRFNATPPIGEAWNYDVVIEEIEVLPGQVVRSARQNSVSFTNLRAGTFASAVAGTTADAPASGDPVDVANKVLDLFNRVKKK